MRPWTWLLILGLCVPAVVATQGEETPEVPELTLEQVDRADGKTLYTNLCASCHGASGRGAGPMAEVLTVEMPDLTSLARNNDGEFPLERVEESIRGTRKIEAHGESEMPVWGPALMGLLDDLTHVDREAFVANRIRKIAEHVESLQAVDE